MIMITAPVWYFVLNGIFYLKSNFPSKIPFVLEDFFSNVRLFLGGNVDFHLKILQNTTSGVLSIP